MRKGQLWAQRAVLVSLCSLTSKCQGDYFTLATTAALAANKHSPSPLLGDRITEKPIAWRAGRATPDRLAGVCLDAQPAEER
jgi:hypothetical protein